MTPTRRQAMRHACRVKSYCQGACWQHPDAARPGCYARALRMPAYRHADNIAKCSTVAGRFTVSTWVVPVSSIKSQCVKVPCPECPCTHAAARLSLKLRYVQVPGGTRQVAIQVACPPANPSDKVNAEAVIIVSLYHLGICYNLRICGEP